MKKRSAVEECDSGNGNGRRRSREQRVALYAKIKGDAVAEFHARQQQWHDWIAVAEIEDRMRERRGDFDRKAQIPGHIAIDLAKCGSRRLRGSYSFVGRTETLEFWETMVGQARSGPSFGFRVARHDTPLGVSRRG
jgi:hypothetical protein